MGRKLEYKQIREAFKRDYREVMDRVMSALEYSEDERERTEDEVVRAIKQSINFSRLRTGKALDPRQSKPYRLANILNDPVTTSFEVFEKRVREARIIKPGSAGQEALNLYRNLNWRVSFDVPELAKKPKKIHETTEEGQQPLPFVPDIEQEIEQTKAKTDIIQVQNQITTLEERTKGILSIIGNLENVVSVIIDKVKNFDLIRDDLDFIRDILKTHWHEDGKIFVEIDQAMKKKGERP